MRVFWDVDGTLISYNDDYPITKAENRELRPHAREVISLLEAVGIENYVWSRAGQGNAQEATHRLGLSSDRAFAKPEFETPEDLQNVPVTPDLVIDDDPDETILVYPHVLVPVYKGAEIDEALPAILSEIRKHYDACEADDQESLVEFRVKFRRKRRIPLRVKLKRRRYYRRRRSYYKRYRRKWKRRPRTKRINRIRKRLRKRFGKRLRRFRMRISV